ncbi:MAG TPA: hypothetical protein VMS09_09575 [Paenibacillus sp.]|uniref:hypothetical protein n=1 Tax=Paenibacillus sp. TaxID=58172 RepID=UPI0028D675C4|nr:hypothetical protein [Paenibacillus sp.]HUC92265.1 hypothetical protein [Paenibacillus sp.]
MAEASNSPSSGASAQDARHEGRDDFDMDIDRMVNEGLGGGQVMLQNGLIDDTTTETMRKERQ